jgi:DNA modification methylase
MNKFKHDYEEQPELLREESGDYRITPEEEEEKEKYWERLKECLRDPEFRKIEGFPIGEDEEILALSDPPYYTACPNPFLGEIIEMWQQERAELRKELGLPDDSQDNGNGLKVYHREPFASDVSEGKNDPIYNAHSYHTKVPHKAVMRYILHYTDPGDIVLDGFCGTGMTGVAAQLCGDNKTVESLGYKVKRDGTILDEKGERISKLGARKAVLVDLSPAATFIAYNYNTPVDARAFEKEARRILKEVEEECGWMYETWHPHCDDPNRVKAKINYTIWSDIFICPNCNHDMIYWDVALDQENGIIRSEWNCPYCNILLAKTTNRKSEVIKVERAWETIRDSLSGKTIRQAKNIPVIVNYSIGRKRLDKRLDKHDIHLLKSIQQKYVPYKFPTHRLPDGVKTKEPIKLGIIDVSKFYSHRNLWTLSYTWDQIHSANSLLLLFWFTASLRGSTKLTTIAINYYFRGGGGAITRGIKGIYYIASIVPEIPAIKSLSSRVRAIVKAFHNYRTEQSQSNSIISTHSSTKIHGDMSNVVDYIFIDPPFGSNLMYSELNILWESWIGVITNNTSEAIINTSQHKSLLEYQGLMEKCFQELYKLLKPGKWITIEFHNSQNAVWNAIQEALIRAGFMIADVRMFDKQQGTFNQVTATGAVKQDLIISAYKQRIKFEQLFKIEGGSLEGAWAFIRQHLEQLPIPAVINDVVEIIAERQNYLLYDRMVAFHIVRGLSVPLSAAEFYQGINQRFSEVDGMYFTTEQAAEYNKRRLGARKVEQLSLFVNDEKSAIQWLRRELDPDIGTGPQTYQDLQPKFLRELHQARYEVLPELREMLEDNFIQDAGGRWYVPNPEKQADLEALRQRSLLREFNEYLKSKGRLKVFRSEAVRAGFSHYWKERDYDTILRVADRLPPIVLEEDQQMLMYVHNASLRQSKQPKQEKLI